MPSSSPSRPTPPETPQVELRLLRYFLAVAQERHFGRAAKRLHISQPPLSQAIRKLETQLGVELFTRKSRGVELTEAGAVLADEACRVLTQVDLAVAETRRAAGIGAPVRVGYTSHMQTEVLHEFVAALEEQDGVEHVDIAHVPTVEQIRRLREGLLDFGIFPHADGQEGLETAPLLPGEPLAAYVAPDHPLAARDAVGPEDLRDEPMLVFQSANPALWEEFRRRLEDAGYRFERLHDMAGSYDGRDGLIAAARQHGVALLTVSMAEVNRAESMVARLPLDPPVSMPHTVVGWRADPAPQLGRIVALVREIAADAWHDGARDDSAAIT